MDMNQRLEDIVYYLCSRYPHKRELAKTRVTKLVYLADVEAARRYGRAVSGIGWVYDHYGPFVHDVHEAVERMAARGEMRISPGVSDYGNNKYQYEVAKDRVLSLEHDLVAVLDNVIETTSTMYWDAFMRYVYNTTPMKNTERYGKLDVERIMVDDRNQRIAQAKRELNVKFGKALKRLASV